MSTADPEGQRWRGWITRSAIVELAPIGIPTLYAYSITGNEPWSERAWTIAGYGLLAWIFSVFLTIVCMTFVGVFLDNIKLADDVPKPAMNAAFIAVAITYLLGQHWKSSEVHQIIACVEDAEFLADTPEDVSRGELVLACSEDYGDDGYSEEPW